MNVPIFTERSQEQAMIADSVADIADEYDHDYWRSCTESSAFPEELWQTLGDNGFLGINVPTEYGGEGLGMPAFATVTETLATHGVPLVFLIITPAMGVIPVREHGTHDLKKRLLPGMASGETKVAFAITEPDAGTNTYKISTTAERDGDEYLVNGQKTYITGAADADYIQLVARTTPYEAVKDDDPRAGVTLLMVPTDDDGIEMTPMNLAIPETTKQYTVHFDNVRVPGENRIGNEGEGFFCLFDALNPERVTTNAISIGLGRFALRRAVEYAKERTVFDVPIGSHQGVQHPLAESKIDLEMAGDANMKAARAIEESDSTAGPLANMAKYAGSVAADEAVDAAIRAHGGAGFSREYDVITIKPMVQLLRTAPVNNNMMLNHVAENVLNLPKSY